MHPGPGRTKSKRNRTAISNLTGQIGDYLAHKEIADSAAVQFDSLERLAQLFDRLRLVISNAQAVSFILFGDLQWEREIETALRLEGRK